MKMTSKDYVEYLKTTIPCDLSGLKVAIDCSNGSASVTAEKLFGGLGARCHILNCTPDGKNINQGCGSTHMEGLCSVMRQGDYDVGLAFDGDADRCLAVDENGELVDGDKMIALFAHHMKGQGKLKNNTAVATVMSNLGLFKFAEKHGILTKATKVGDRYVLELSLIHISCALWRDYNAGGNGV